MGETSFTVIFVSRDTIISQFIYLPQFEADPV